jgi:hypothetical protein
MPDCLMQQASATRRVLRAAGYAAALARNSHKFESRYLDSLIGGPLCELLDCDATKMLDQLKDRS